MNEITKQKSEDFLKSLEHEVIDFSLEGILPELAKNLSQGILPELINDGVQTLIYQFLGAISPRVYSMVSAYKQKRWERNIETTIQMLIDRQDEIEDGLNRLKQENSEYLNSLNEMVLDNIIEEIQPEFVKYNVNGYIHFVKSDNTSEDISLMFFRTLSQLNGLDIRILKIYTESYKTETILEIRDDLNISDDQIRMVKQKLERLGMLESINDQIESYNFDLIEKYFNQYYRDIRRSKPKGAEPPKLKRQSRINRYKISQLGLDYLKIIEEK